MSENKKDISKEKTEKKEKVSKKEMKDKEKIKKLEAELEEVKGDFLRARADYDNFRRRVEKEKTEIRDRAVISFVENLIPSIDNFEMSLKMKENTDMFVKGVEMIHKNLIDTLKEHNFEQYEANVGDLFDVNLHEPMLIENKEAEVGKIVNVLTKGYKHKDKVIRPVRVQIPKEED